MKFVLTILIITSCFLDVRGQGSFIDNIGRNAKRDPAKTLFLHLDKTLYTNNEEIFFSAYLLDDLRNTDTSSSILSTLLIERSTGKARLKKDFLIKGGLSFGSMILPDTIAPGSYTFVAFSPDTSKNGMPILRFEQSLVVLNIRDHLFDATLTLSENSDQLGSVKLDVSLKFPESLKKDIFTFNYTDESGKEIVIPLKQGTNKLDVKPARNAVMRRSFTGAVHHQEQSRKFLTVALPRPDTTGVKVRFFPEGGYMVDGRKNNVAFEVSVGDRGVITTAYLFKNSSLVDSTSTSSAGIGKFLTSSSPKDKYHIQLKNSGSNHFPFPTAINTGVVIHVAKAVVNDTLLLEVQNGNIPGKIIIHNYEDIFGIAEISAGGPTTKKLTVLLDAVPVGLTAVTFVGQDEKPYAERLFFAHHDRLPTVKISHDSLNYKPRDSVFIKIKMNDHNGSPLQGILSAAVIQQNRLQPTNAQDIESYTHLGIPLGTLPPYMHGKGLADRSAMEEFLLVKSWRKYSWQDAASSPGNDTLITPVKVSYKGKALFNNKPLKESVDLILQNVRGMTLVTTATDGTFELDHAALLVKDGGQATLAVNKQNKAGYTIFVNDPLLVYTDRVVKTITPVRAITAEISVPEVSTVPVLSDSTVKIEVVSVKTKRHDDAVFGRRGIPGPNECGDYVDDYNYLNYGPHAGRETNFQPVKGKAYLIRTNSPQSDNYFTVKSVIYQG
ncbi:MAG: hypothetical protein EOO01_11825, partial [Chitinophagaceae bacterium]